MKKIEKYARFFMRELEGKGYDVERLPMEIAGFQGIPIAMDKQFMLGIVILLGERVVNRIRLIDLEEAASMAAQQAHLQWQQDVMDSGMVQLGNA